MASRKVIFERIHSGAMAARAAATRTSTGTSLGAAISVLGAARHGIRVPRGPIPIGRRRCVPLLCQPNPQPPIPPVAPPLPPSPPAPPGTPQWDPSEPAAGAAAARFQPRRRLRCRQVPRAAAARTSAQVPEGSGTASNASWARIRPVAAVGCS